MLRPRMGLLDRIKGLFNKGGEPADYPLPEGGIDALRADEQTALASGITPQEADRLAERDDE
jgi:hypothetical protein